jgi:hypothetical protein
LVEEIRTNLTDKYVAEANDLKRAYEEAFVALRERYIRAAKKTLEK